MNRMRTLLTLILITGLAGIATAKDLKIGGKAPDFTLSDSYGKPHSLKDYRGKYVVLEWVNYQCPFVGKHYNSGHMQMLQKKYTDEGVVWLSICSSAKGKQGYYEPHQINREAAQRETAFTAYLIDADGQVGKWYDARTTPHMFIIDPEGKLVYAGGIDDIRSTNLADIPKAFNYVSSALDALLAGSTVEVTTSQPYGCSVKY